LVTAARIQIGGTTMNKHKTLALSILTALIAATPVLTQTAMAQTTKPADTMKADTMKPGTTMKAAPNFMFSKDQGMNMMMSGGAVDIAQVPGEKLISKSISGQAATLVYSGKNSLAIFTYYDKAIKSEGWKTTAMDGRMMADTMAKPADAVAKPTGAMMGGTHSATFALGGHTIDLLVRESGGRVTVSFKSK
jgi:hypothetical protein